MDTLLEITDNKTRPFKGLRLELISNATLLAELRNPAISLLRKKAIANAMSFAKRLTEETKGMYPSWLGMPNPGGSVPYWFCENRETGLIHIQSDFTWYCYHPGYIFDTPQKDSLTIHARAYYPS